MSMMRRWVPWLVGLLFWSGCGESSTEPEDQRPAAELVHEALLGAGKDCDTAADCASGVCQMGLCRSLLDSDQAWMEKAVADRVREYLERDPAVGEQLFGEQLAALEEGDPFGQGRFIGFMGHLGDARALPILTRWSRSKVERVAVLAVLARVRLGDESAFTPARELLTHRSLAIRLEALDALAPVLERAGAADDVVALLAATDHRLRQRAVLALGRLETRSAAVDSALRALLDSESDGFLRADVLRALK